MGKKGNTSRCGHVWRRPKKTELDPHDNPQRYVVCRRCGTILTVPLDLIPHYDFYFPSFPEDDKD